MGKEFRAVTKDDIRSYLNHLQNRGLKQGSIDIIKTRLRTFYMWLNNNKGYPECVEWLRAGLSYRSVFPQDVLKEDEIGAMIEAGQNLRDKAIVAVLYESGCRAGEFVGMCIKDIEFDDYGAKVKVKGKTGERIIRLINSVPYLKQWLKCHPLKNNPDTPVWIETDSEQEGRVEGLTTAMVNHIIKRIAKNAQIKKRVYSHLIRHSRATATASKIPEAYMKRMFGWTDKSDMPSRYIGITQQDVDSLIMKAIYGIDTTNKVEKINKRLMPKTCFNCGENNPFDFDYCTKCNFPLDENAIKMREKRFMALLTPEMIEKMIEEKVEELLMQKIAAR